MHSQLFQKMDLPFLRCVSAEMHTRRIFPGEIVYQKHSYKHQMIYVASGVIEVLSETCGDTPVLSLSAGTCVGESTLLFGYPSTVSLRCRDHGEIHVLKMSGLVKTSSKFPEQYWRLIRIIDARYHTAKELCAVGVALDESFQVKTKTRDLTLMWLTSTLHRLMAKEGDESQIHECQNIYLREEADEERFNLRQFFATYLNMLAITERASILADSVFVKYKCPPVLQPDSIIRFTWDFTLCFLTFCSCIIIPFYFALPSLIPHWYWTFVSTVTLLYVFDVYINITTVVYQNGNAVTNIVEILQYKLSSLSFWIDIFAAFPLEILRNLVFHKHISELDVVLHLNRLGKLVGTVLLIEKFEKYSPAHASVIRRLKHSLPFVYISYFITCAFFRLEANLLSLTINDLPGYIQYGYQICATVGFQQIYEVVETTYLNYYVIVYLTLIVYTTTISKYAAERIQAETHKYNFRKILLRMQSAANAFKVSGDYKKRMQHYIITQWQYDNGLQLVQSTTMLQKLPISLYQSVMADVISASVKNIPLFKDLSEEILFKICSTAQLEVLSPREIICYNGSLQNNFHYILSGYVEIIDPSFNRIVGVIGPSSTISVLETCLNVHVLYTYITSTHCKLLTFSLPSIVSILSSELNENNVTEKNPLFEEIRDDLKRIYNQKRILDYNLKPRKDAVSFRSFGYNFQLDSIEEYEYYVPFDRCGIFSFIRIFLLHTTVLPFGRFLFCWEVGRSIFAVLSATLFVVNPLVTCWSCEWKYLLYILDLVAWIDIYVRFHVCYYSDSGILISHPVKTAQHYLTHAFVVDVIAAFPFALFFYPKTATAYKLYTFLHCTRIIQMYRYLGLIDVIHTPFSSYYRTIAVLKYIPLVLVFCNCLSSLVSNIHCDFHESIKNDLFENGVECTTGSFYLESEYRTPLSRLDVHFFSFVFVVRYLTTSGISTSNVVSQTDISITIGLIICGFMLHIALLLRFIAAFTEIRPMLTEYQKPLKTLKRFLKSRKVDKFVQRDILEHYELKWEVTHGENLTQATQQLWRSIREDMLYAVFGTTLEAYSVFKHKTAVYFLRALLFETEHETVTAGTTICFVNQVIAELYILFKGTVEVVAPDGAKLVSLQKGSLFGNLDDYHRVRQTISIRAASDCEVLAIDARRFYAILAGFSQLHKQFKYLTLLHIDYLPGKQEAEKVEGEIFEKQKKYNRRYSDNVILLRIWNLLVFLLVLFSTVLQVYMQCLREHNFFLLTPLYLCDVVYILNFVSRCPCSKTKIKDLRSFLSLKVLLFILDSIPLDLAAWFLTNNRFELIFLLRLNRFLRIRYFFEYFEQFSNRLYVSANLIKTLKLSTMLTITLHIMSCINISVNCTNPPNYAGEFNCGVLKYTDNKHRDKLLLYLQHVYITASCFLLGTMYNYFPVSLRISLYLCPVLLLSAFLFAFSTAYVISIIRTGALSFITHQSTYLSMRNYMKSENLSTAIVNKVCYNIQCMWKARNEPVFPEMLEKAPITLKLQAMECCYSEVITEHPIFKNCHADFLRQLVLAVKLNRYFAGDYVAFKGDINGCMYFIHKGKIELLQEDTQFKADVVSILTAGQAFGVKQGLHVNKPHEYFFKSLNNTVILVLERARWEYLLEYFPASREAIYGAADANYFSF